MAEVNDNGSIQLFEDQKIRTAWDAEKEEWYFSIIDAPRPRCPQTRWVPGMPAPMP